MLPLPQGVPPGRAVLTANMEETAVNGLWDAGPRLWDRIVVIGAGVVGALVAYLCARIPGTRVQLVDVEPTRASLAEALGVAFCMPADAQGDHDLVIHASGSPQGLRTGLALAGHQATLVEMSWFGQQEVSLPLGEAFHARRLTIRSSQAGSISPARSARRDHRRRLSLALELLADARLDALISDESPFKGLPALMPRLAARPDGTLCHRLRY